MKEEILIVRIDKETSEETKLPLKEAIKKLEMWYADKKQIKKDLIDNITLVTPFSFYKRG